METMELYIHIPFCVKKCSYCDFLSFPQGEEVKRQYVDKLLEEIKIVSGGYADRQVSSIFVGGGTPSVLPGAWMEEIFAYLRKYFNIEETAEISVEANPGTVSEEKLGAYKRAGINRLSLGLQSSNDRELMELGRIHTYGEFLESFRLARAAGFQNINVDLMCALPGQTVESFMETLEKTADLNPEHISAYSLIVEEGTPFYEMYGEGKGACLLPDEEEERQMYHKTREFLKSRGYERYEISNYAKRGKECRHNVGYWTGVSYLGLGLGASSYVNGIRFRNERDLKKYLNEMPGKRLDEEILTPKDMQEEFFFVGLRMVCGVSLKQFEETFGMTAEAVYPGLMERFVREGAALLEGGRFKLTEYGMDVSNYIMEKFLQG